MTILFLYELKKNPKAKNQNKISQISLLYVQDVIKDVMK